jgi:hypothetical protein
MVKKPMLYARIEDMLTEVLREYGDLQQVNKKFVYEGVCRRFRVSKDDLREVMKEISEMNRNPVSRTTLKIRKKRGSKKKEYRL